MLNKVPREKYEITAAKSTNFVLIYIYIYMDVLFQFATPTYIDGEEIATHSLIKTVLSLNLLVKIGMHNVFVGMHSNYIYRSL